MMELVDMLGMSALGSISRFGTSNLKRVGGGFRGLFCDSKPGVPKILFGDIFSMRGDPFKKKTDHTTDNGDRWPSL